MGNLVYGWVEKIECIQPVALKGAEGEALCLAYKTGKYVLGAGVYLRDDGYVLGDPAAPDRYYHWPDASQLKAWQAEGLIPAPLPGYSVPGLEYASGYSLWIILGLFAGIVGSIVAGRKLQTKRRQALDAQVPLSLGPPKLLTDGDRFIHSSATALLGPGEVIQHQALAVPEPQGAVGMLVVVTNLRVLVMVVDRPGQGAVVSSSSYLRSEVVDAREGSYEVTLVLASGSKRSYPVVRDENEFSNQRAFVRDVPRMFAKKAAVGGPAMRVMG